MAPQPWRGPNWLGMVDAAWRAALYMLLPRTILLSLAPLLLGGGALAILAWWGWADANAWVRDLLDMWSLGATLQERLSASGYERLRVVLVPLIIILVAVPVVVALCLLLVSAFMAPAMTAMIRARRFPDLRSTHQTPVWQSVAWSLAWSVGALIAWLVTIPLWLIPLVGVAVPALIWGVLTYQVMSYDVLADVATPQERQTLMRRHRGPLLCMGLVSSFLGAIPTAIWALLGVGAVVLAPFMLMASVWLYTFVFAYAALWFAHYLLTALADERHVPSVIDMADE